MAWAAGDGGEQAVEQMAVMRNILTGPLPGESMHEAGQSGEEVRDKGLKC